MTKLTKILTAAALTGIVGFTALSPAIAAGPGDNGPGDRGPGQERGMQRGPGGGFLRLICDADGAERLETGLSRITEKVELTDEQTGLFEDFKSAALIAQTNYADNCIAPVAEQDRDEVDLIDRMQNRQTNMYAQLAAMESVMPSLEAFFDSLTDEQKADLRPDRDERRGPGGPGERQGALDGQNGPNGPVGPDGAIPEDPANAA